MHVYCPTRFGSSIAFKRNAVLAPVKIVDRIKKYGQQFAEIAHYVTGEYLGLVAVGDIVSVGDHKLTKKNKLTILRRLAALKASVKLNGGMMRKATPRNTADNPIETPRPAAKLTVPRMLNKARQKFRQIAGGIREALAIKKFREIVGKPTLGKRQAKQNAKKITLIGDDVLFANIAVDMHLIAPYAEKIAENAGKYPIGWEILNG